MKRVTIEEMKLFEWDKLGAEINQNFASHVGRQIDWIWNFYYCSSMMDDAQLAKQAAQSRSYVQNQKLITSRFEIEEEDTEEGGN